MALKRIGTPFSRSLLRSAQLRSFSASARSRAQWGFVGLGQMGYNMARNLQRRLPSSVTLLVHDLNTTATSQFIEEAVSSGAGATVKVAGSVREAAENSETVITVLPESAHVKNVIGAIMRPPLSTENIHKERLFIDCSTIDPGSSREVANAIHTTEQGRFVDAPMSGGVVGAKAGTLTFMLGAPINLVPRIEPILEMMGKRILHCGEQGAGLAGKLANNYLLAINNIATAEAMNFGIKLGLEPKILANVINISTGKCWPSEVNNPVPGVVEGAPAERDYSGGFGVTLMKKDLGLALVAAQEADAKLELGPKAQEVYEAVARDEQYVGKDFSVVYRYLGGDR